MAYADYGFYSDSYFGDTLTAENASRWLDRASDYVDAITFHRTENTFPEVEAHIVKVKKAVCAIADALYKIDMQVKAASAAVDATGSLRTAVASISSGRESISFAQGATGSVYAKAAVDDMEKKKLLGNIAAEYLAGIPDSEGVNLLYAGVG